MRDNKLVQVRALLAKAESTEYPEEAEAFSAKASELMMRYCLDEAMLAQRGAQGARRREVVQRRIRMEAPYALRKTTLLGVVARCHGCQLVTSSDGDLTTCHVFGFKSEVECLTVLYTSLLVQLDREMLGAWQALGDKPHRRSWGVSFYAGFTVALRERLAERRAEVTSEVEAATGRSVALAVVRDDEAVLARVAAAFPRLRAGRRLSAPSSASGFHEGRAAGRWADVGRPRVGAVKALTG